MDMVLFGAGAVTVALVLTFAGNPLELLARYAGIFAAIAGAVTVAVLVRDTLEPLTRLASIFTK